MRLLVCGDRNWTDRDAIARTIAALPAPVDVVMHGDARGADTIAADVARSLGLAVVAYPADWRRYGRGAGPMRNQQMIDVGRPTFVLAFHADIERSRGTADMVRRATRAGIPVRVECGGRDCGMTAQGMYHCPTCHGSTVEVPSPDAG